MCGLRSDLIADRIVTYQVAERTAEGFGAPYIECSAKLDQNVEAVFDLVLTQIFKQEKKARDAKKSLRTFVEKQADPVHLQKQDDGCCLLF